VTGPGRPPGRLTIVGRRDLLRAANRAAQLELRLAAAKLELAAVAARVAREGASRRAIAAELELSSSAAHKLIRAGELELDAVVDDYTE
jgi:hypothetical protein